MVGMRLFGGIILIEFSFCKNFETVGPGANACRAVLGLSGRSSCSEGNRIILDCLLCPVERHLCCNSNSGPLEEQLFTPKPSISPALKDLSQTDSRKYTTIFSPACCSHGSDLGLKQDRSSYEESGKA